MQVYIHMVMGVRTVAIIAIPKIAIVVEVTVDAVVVEVPVLIIAIITPAAVVLRLEVVITSICEYVVLPLPLLFLPLLSVLFAILCVLPWPRKIF